MYTFQSGRNRRVTLWNPSQAQLSHKYLNNSYTVYTCPLFCNSNMFLNLQSENIKHAVDEYLEVSLLTYKHKHTKTNFWPSQTTWRWRNPDSPQSHYQDTRFALIRQEETLQLQKNNSLSKSTDYVQEASSHVNISPNANLIFPSAAAIKWHLAHLKVLAFLCHFIIIKTVQQSKHMRECHLTEVLYLPRAVIQFAFVDELLLAFNGSVCSISYVLKKKAWKKRERAQIFQTLTALLSPKHCIP